VQIKGMTASPQQYSCSVDFPVTILVWEAFFVLRRSWAIVSLALGAVLLPPSTFAESLMNCLCTTSVAQKM
jgi:hypothetical protein